MNLNLNTNINGVKRALPYPTVGLDVIVYFNSTYEDGGTTYVRTSKGIGLPVISGTGLNRIIDFSPLNDVRFDKGSYVGNAYGLPATYNYPYVGIYYDATSEATRYHWKMTDFAYAVILAQSLLVDNMFFLKATATTDTSNIIATVDRLFIYSTALTGVNLSKMKTYIGIQDDFEGDELLTTLHNSPIYPFDSFLFVSGNLTASDDGANFSALLLNGISTLKGDIFHVYYSQFNLLSGTVNPKIFFQSISYGVGSGKSNFIDNYTLYSNGGYLTISESGTWYFEIGDKKTNYSFQFLGLSLKQFYQNYYKS